MPVDARIALGVEPVKMPDFAQLAVQRAAVQNSMAELAAKQRALNEQNTLAQLMQAPDFDFNNPEKRSLVMRYAPNIGAEVIKNHDLAAEAQVKAQAAARAEKEAQRAAALKELFQYDTFEGAEAAIDAKVAQGALTQAQADAVKARMRASPDYTTFAFNHARSMLSPEQMTEVTRDQIDTGGEIVDRAIPKYAPVGTEYTEIGRTPKVISPDEAADNARAAANERQQSTRPLTGVNEAGDMIVMSPNILSDPRVNPTGASSIVIPGAGKPSGGFEKAQAARGESYKQISAALPIIDELLKPGSNLDKAKGGLLQALINGGFAAVGITTDEAAAQAKLGPQGFGLLIQVPRFEGPQGVLDVKLYEQAAGKLTDPLATAGQKRAALETIREIMLREKAYLDKNPQAGAAKTAPPSGGKVIDWADLQ